tara:strand:- start:395 stop:943 length:549 start_codon:yes stop_codon:yes gene_type:complete
MLLKEYYRTNAGITPAVRDALIEQCGEMRHEPGTIFRDGKKVVDKNWRSSRNVWLYADNWVGGMMAHWVQTANTMHYNFDLTTWETRIQYTEYGPGDKYAWHIDGTEDPKLIRKLSISLCLSERDEYEGGEFQIMLGAELITMKMDLGDVIVFPADAMHRVRPVKSGKRISLVGWYGGPNFK